MESPRARWIVLVAAMVGAAGLAVAGKGRPGDSEPRKGKGSRMPAAMAATAPAGQTGQIKGLAPIPLELPKAKIIGTPTNPVGVRLKPWPKDIPVPPREPFLAPPGTTNVARGKPVASSDPAPVVGDPKMVTDGNKEAGEETWVELGPGNQHVQIDLGRPCTLHAVVVWHEHARWVVYHDVVVQVADDKDFITNVRTIFSNDHDNSAGLGMGADWAEYFETAEGLLVHAKGVKARYVRLYSNGSTADDLNHYTEVEVYGIPAK